MDKVFFADKILKFVMYNKKLKNKMAVFAVYDALFQMSLIGMILVVIMVALRENTLENVRYTLIASGLGGLVSVYFDMGKVKSGKLKLEPKMDTDTRDFILTILLIAAYVCSIAYLIWSLI